MIEHPQCFELWQDSAGLYRWVLWVDNRRVAASGEGYSSHADCMRSIALVKDQAAHCQINDKAQGRWHRV